MCFSKTVTKNYKISLKGTILLTEIVYKGKYFCGQLLKVKSMLNLI